MIKGLLSVGFLIVNYNYLIDSGTARSPPFKPWPHCHFTLTQAKAQSVVFLRTLDMATPLIMARF